jgi:hypothetical protein
MFRLIGSLPFLELYPVSDSLVEEDTFVFIDSLLRDAAFNFHGSLPLDELFYEGDSLR